MGEDRRSLFTQQLLNSQSPDFNSTAAPFINSAGLNTISSLEGSPMYTFHGLSNSRIGQCNQPQGWFYCLPRFRQAFTPGPNYSAMKEKLSINCEKSDLNADKKFLVFDQSGDQTTVMMSSGPRTPFQCVTSWTLNQMTPSGMDDKAYGAKPDSYPVSGPISGNDLSDNNEADVASEMHEDTEELNALLYSDDEAESYHSEEDDEIASTGHSPSTMIAHESSDHFHRDKEKVPSSNWARKRKWNADDVEALDDAASSAEINGQLNYLSNDGDAKSSCAEQESSGFSKMGLSSESKRAQREKICKTVGLLQEIIPVQKGKDAMIVLDEAIDYLKSLKVRAKALGLAAL